MTAVSAPRGESTVQGPERHWLDVFDRVGRPAHAERAMTTSTLADTASLEHLIAADPDPVGRRSSAMRLLVGFLAFVLCVAGAIAIIALAVVLVAAVIGPLLAGAVLVAAGTLA